jgi:hypothetical protein
MILRGAEPQHGSAPLVENARYHESFRWGGCWMTWRLRRLEIRRTRNWTDGRTFNHPARSMYDGANEGGMNLDTLRERLRRMGPSPEAVRASQRRSYADHMRMNPSIGRPKHS